jgi:hypothetical protein
VPTSRYGITEETHENFLAEIRPRNLLNANYRGYRRSDPLCGMQNDS